MVYKGHIIHIDTHSKSGFPYFIAKIVTGAMQADTKLTEATANTLDEAVKQAKAYIDGLSK